VDCFFAIDALGRPNMPYTIRYDEELGYIIVTVEGQLDLSVLESLASDVAKAVEKHSCRRIFNDLRRARLKSIVDTYYMPKVMERSGIALSCKRAFVVREVTSDFNFFETVFVNQGHQVKMFDRIDKAKQWLLEDYAYVDTRNVGRMMSAGTKYG
jgi:hypothetical protein